MFLVSVSELKAKLSEHLRRVKAGEEILVTERGRVVAKLSAPPRADAEDATLQRLADAGLVKLGPGIPDGFWELPRPEDPQGSVLRGFLEEREEAL